MRFWSPAVLATLLPWGLIAAQTSQDGKPDLTELSLNDLLNVQVEIVSRRAEPVSEAPAAVSVITGDEIRRSGAQTLPDVLRLATGVNVARQNGNFWAVSIRGFQDVFANKLLVMMDGRSVYTPLFSGTFWDVQDAVLTDIDRVEIIRGPGATVWGANAVNGVINIRSKSAVDTLGTVVSAGYGSELQGVFSARHGLKLADDLFLRIYGKHTTHDHLRNSAGDGASDGFRTGRGGFRMEWLPESGAELTLQGEIYGGKVENVYSTAAAALPNVNGVGGGHLLGRYQQQVGAGRLSLQAYYDRSVRQSLAFEENRDTGDVDARYEMDAGERHSFALGAGYRVSGDDVAALPIVSFTPAQRVTHLASFFLQDKIELVDDRLSLTVGTKLQHNQFTGVEVQPSARVRARPKQGHTAWVAVSRAVRTPSRTDDDVTVNGFSPLLGLPTRIDGNRAIESETLLAWEAGYRVKVSDKFTFDTAVYYNLYDDLRSIETVASPPPPVVFTGRNLIEGESYGIELSPSMQLQDWWRVGVSYSYQQLDLRADPGSTDTITPREEDQSPDHTVTLTSRMNLAHDVQLDVFARYVDQIFIPRANGGAGQAIASYWNLDVRLGWRPTANLELSLLGQNLLDDRHAEFSPTFISVGAAEVERSVFGLVTYRF